MTEMTTNPTDAQMKLAREYAAKVRPYSHNSALILDGERDGTDIVQSALLTIQATEARVQGLVEALEWLDYHADNQDMSHRDFRIQGAIKARQALAAWKGSKQ